MGISVANLPEKVQMNNNQASQSSSTKVERRVVEKNRRNHLKLLYSKLYSLLPNQNPKEPPSLNEQIDEAINYIKSQESKLQKAKEKKESLMGTRKRSNATAFVNVESMEPKTLNIESVRSTKAPQIQIHETGSTVGVVLTSGLENHQFIFYEIIRILDEEQADIVHASFSTLGDTVFHVVRAEMDNSILDFGAARITEKLNTFVNGSTSDQELRQDCFWDCEFEPAEIIWDQASVSGFERLSGLTVLKNWDSSVTHIIASTDENGACRSTLKVLMGILEGKWILSVEWINACT